MKSKHLMVCCFTGLITGSAILSLALLMCDETKAQEIDSRLSTPTKGAVVSIPVSATNPQTQKPGKLPCQLSESTASELEWHTKAISLGAALLGLLTLSWIRQRLLYRIFYNWKWSEN